MDNQVFLGSKITQSNSKVEEKQPSSFREQFQKKMAEEIRIYKMQQAFPNFKPSLRKEKLRTETDETILIRALRKAR